MSKAKALPQKATSKKVAPSKKLKAKFRAVNQKIEDERIAALRVEQKRTEINREASKVIHRYRENLGHYDKQGVKHKLHRLLSISREKNKRINEEGLVFNFSEAEHFAKLFKVIVEFF